MAELHKDLETYYETIDRTENKAEKQLAQLQERLYEDVEAHLDDLAFELKKEFSLVTSDEYQDVLSEVLKQFV